MEVSRICDPLSYLEGMTSEVPTVASGSGNGGATTKSQILKRERPVLGAPFLPQQREQKGSQPKYHTDFTRISICYDRILFKARAKMKMGF